MEGRGYKERIYDIWVDVRTDLMDDDELMTLVGDSAGTPSAR